MRHTSVFLLWSRPKSFFKNKILILFCGFLFTFKSGKREKKETLMSGVAEKCHNFLDYITRHNLPSMIIHTHNIRTKTKCVCWNEFSKNRWICHPRALISWNGLFLAHYEVGCDTWLTLIWLICRFTLHNEQRFDHSRVRNVQRLPVSSSARLVLNRIRFAERTPPLLSLFLALHAVLASPSFLWFSSAFSRAIFSTPFAYWIFVVVVVVFFIFLYFAAHW